MQKNHPEVIYIVASTRSGSSILQSVLANTIARSFQAGELRRARSLWLNQDTCSCGEVLSSCPFWSGILLTRDASACMNLFVRPPGRFPKMRYVLSFLLLWLRQYGLANVLLNSGVEAVENWNESIYRISEKAGVEVIIDSSKTPMQFLHLKLMYPDRVKGLFLVRNGYAASWSKKRRTGMNLRKAAIQWRSDCRKMLLVKLLVSRSSPIIRYEDMCGNEDGCMRSICEKFDIDSQGKNDRNEVLAAHTLGGSPSVKPSDKKGFLLDDSWKRQMKKADYQTIKSIIDPTNRYFGYS